MKTRLTILLLIIWSLSFGQNTIRIAKTDTITELSNTIIISPDVVYDLTDSSTIGLIAYWSSYYENNVDSLTFNSTGDLISSIDGSTVTLDGGDNVIIGNAVRFGDPESGTVYTITDTVASSSVIILDQSCTASETEEFYIGCIGSITDQGSSYNLTQSTGINQPKILWFKTDSVQMYFDGVNDVLIGSNIIELNGSVNYAITFWINPKNYTGLKGIFGNSNVSGTEMISVDASNLIPRFNTYSGSYGNVSSGITVNADTWYFISIIKTGSVASIYIDTELKNSGTVKNPSSMTNCNLGTRENTSYKFLGKIEDFRIYDRAISTSIMHSLYQNSRFNYSYITITFNNSSNPHSLNNYIAEIDFDNSYFINDAFPSNIENLYFTRNGVRLDHYIDVINTDNNELKVFVKLNIPANSTRTITMRWDETSNTSVDWDEMFQRRSAYTTTRNLYKFNSLYDSEGVGNTIELTNATLISNDFGTVLDCNGTNAYATIEGELPDFGWLSFNWILKSDHQAGDGVKTIFSRYYDADNFINFRLQNNGTLNFNYMWEGHIGNSYATTKASWTAGSVNYFSMRFIKNDVNGWGLLKLNINEITMNPHDFKTIRVTGGEPFTFGCYNDGSKSNFCDVQIFDFEIGEGNIPIGEELARNRGIPVFKDKEFNKWEYMLDFPSTAPDGYLRQEPGILSIRDTLFLWNADESVGGTEISRAYSVDDGFTWSEPIAATGLPLASCRPFAFYENDTIYIMSSYGNIAKSLDGINFFDQQVFLSDRNGEVQNISIINDNGIYKGFASTRGIGGGWNSYLIEGNSLYNMDFKTGDSLNSILLGTYRVFSGGFLLKVDDTYHAWFHGPIPSTVWRFTSENWGEDDWQYQYNGEIFTFDSEWCVDQKQDIAICEHNGYVYAAVNNSDNFPSVVGNTSIYRYEGTLKQLVSDLIITMSGF